MKMRTPVSFSLLFALAVACSQESAVQTAPASTTQAATSPVALSGQGNTMPHPGGMDRWSDDAPRVPAEKFENGERAFRTVKETLLAHYYASGLTEDDLYRAAAEGMLQRADPRMYKWNKLLSPSELAELEADMKGEIIGIGVNINFDTASGYTDILGVIGNSPAERAKLQPGDKIISVDGKLYKGKTAKDVANDIRGKSGETVTLTVLREDKLLTIPVKRDVVPIESVYGLNLPGDVAYVNVGSFNGKTTATLQAVLEKMTSAKAMIVDLRCSPGGLFEEAVAAASFFLKPGTPVVQLEKRGEPSETVAAKGTRIIGDVPMVVIVDHDTSSGGEFVAAALSEQRGAQVVGTRTFGKWSVQKIDKLPNGYAMKYTTSLFHTPSGKSYDGVGFAPDVEVAADEKVLEKAFATRDPDKRVAQDVQLRTALQLLRARK